MVLVVFLALMLPFTIGTLQLSRRSVLELLQGVAARKEKKSAKAAAEISAEVAPAGIGIGAIPPISSGSRLNKVLAMLRYSMRQIVRSPLKSSLTAVVALFFLLSISWLQMTIERNEIEIEHLYNTTFVSGEVEQATFIEIPPPDRLLGDIITHHALTALLERGFVYNAYIESVSQSVEIFPQDVVMATNSLVGFIAANSRNPDFEIPGVERFLDGEPIAEFVVEFAEGLSSENFAFVQGAPIPVIISADIMAARGLELGEVVGQAWIIGRHNRHILAGHEFRDAVIMPLEALQELKGPAIGYSTLRFTIDPQFNRDIDSAQQAIRAIMSAGNAGFVGLITHFDDEELRYVVGPMEDNLSLMRILYPVAIAISLAIGAGLSLLITLQNTKNAALKRVLGVERAKTGIMLWLEVFAVCLIGLILGLGAINLMWNALPIAIAAIYMLGAAIGAIAGITIATNRAPLDLLQVKE
ncbi:MAG: hypothetical protein LBE35_05170 [Clostridiales bacterium]|jgi:hypothetical protein|nr:hypothetical protein [Clostridiales bacterium]